MSSISELVLLFIAGLISGQRYDLVFNADQTPGNYWLRAFPATGCSASNNQDGIRAIVTYDGVTEDTPNSNPYTPSDTNCEDETQLVPIVQRDISSLSYGAINDVALPSTPLVRWTINGSSFRTDYENPSLLLIEDNDPSFPTNYNAIELNGNDTTV